MTPWNSRAPWCLGQVQRDHVTRRDLGSDRIPRTCPYTRAQRLLPTSASAGSMGAGYSPLGLGTGPAGGSALVVTTQPNPLRPLCAGAEGTGLPCDYRIHTAAKWGINKTQAYCLFSESQCPCNLVPVGEKMG